jgi:hypothetical protein
MAANCSYSIVSAIVSLVSVALGGFVGFVSAILISTRNDRLRAASQLRAAFAPQMAELRLAGADGPMIEKLLGDAFMHHAAAIEEYRPYVKANARESYDEAWRNYYEVGNSVRFHDYSVEGGRDIFYKRVGEILSYAKPPHQ